MNPAETLASHVVLTMTQTAAVLALHHARGAKAGLPDRRRAIELVRAGRLRLVDPEQPVHRWTVASAEIRRYLESTVAVAS